MLEENLEEKIGFLERIGERVKKNLVVYSTVAALTLGAGVFNDCGYNDEPGGFDAGRKEICQINEYKCDNNTLYKCEENREEKDWVAVNQCDITHEVCDTEIPGCVRKEPPAPDETCETREVPLNCDDAGRTWQYSKGNCGSSDKVCATPYTGYNLACSRPNLCGDDNYNSPALWIDQWISVTFNDVELSLTRLIVTYFGKSICDHCSPPPDHVGIQVDELPSKIIQTPSEESCEPATVFFEGEELISPTTRRNIAYDGEVRVNLNGVYYWGDSGSWISRVVATFCYPETNR